MSGIMKTPDPLILQQEETLLLEYDLQTAISIFRRLVIEVWEKEISERTNAPSADTLKFVW